MSTFGNGQTGSSGTINYGYSGDTINYGYPSGTGSNGYPSGISNYSHPGDNGYSNAVSAYGLNPCLQKFFDTGGPTWSGTSIIQARNNNGTYYSKFN